jgi:quinol monooxygenase YgiN
MVTMGMVVVAGHLVVDPDEREAYLESCREAVDLARRTEGCLDFAISADLVDPARINVLERWESQEAVESFRGEGPSGDQQQAIRGGSVAEYGAVEERLLLS